MTASFALYLDRRVRAVFIFGILSGLPWVMIGSALTLWLKDRGVSRTEIGYAALIFSVFSINFLWAPLVDRLRPPGGRWLGWRKAWMLPCQLLVIAACVAMATLGADLSPKLLVLLALLIALAAATQDIAIDAYRVDQFDNTETEHIAAGAAAATAGWWTGYAGLGYLPLALADSGWPWEHCFGLLAALFAVIALCGLPAPEASRSQPPPGPPPPAISAAMRRTLAAGLLAPFALILWALMGAPGLPDFGQWSGFVPVVVALVAFTWAVGFWALQRLASGRPPAPPPLPPALVALGFLRGAMLEPLADFFRRNGVRTALMLLAFVVLFKLGEAFLGRMSIVFYKEVGYSTGEIAQYSKLLTWWVTILAALPCGYLNAKLGLYRGLLISGIAMAASNLLLSLIAMVGPSVPLYIVMAVVDGVTGVWGSVAFVAFISALCNRNFSASQYALLASLAAFGRSTLSAFSGLMVDGLGGNWAVFFAVTAAMVIPSLWLLRGLYPRLEAGVLSTPNGGGQPKP